MKVFYAAIARDVTRSARALLTLSVTLTLGAASALAQPVPGESGLEQPIIRYDSIHHPVKGRFGMVVS